MTEEEKMRELADILNVAPKLLTPATLLTTTQWDSMALLAYLAFLRFKFNIIIPNASCATFKTVADLLARMS
ncbi:MAG: hypothetical protein RR982_04195 [Kiritimatiellia bacterium]